MSTRFAKRSCIKGLRDVDLETKLMQEDNNVIVCLSAYDDVVSKHGPVPRDIISDVPDTWVILYRDPLVAIHGANCTAE
jgi:hypothetical protein